MMGQLIFEIKIQSFVTHPNTLRMYGYFHDEKYIYMLLELASSGCLFRELKSKVERRLLRCALKNIRRLTICGKSLQASSICTRTPSCIVISSRRTFSTASAFSSCATSAGRSTLRCSTQSIKAVNGKHSAVPSTTCHPKSFKESSMTKRSIFGASEFSVTSSAPDMHPSKPKTTNSKRTIRSCRSTCSSR